MQYLFHIVKIFHLIEFKISTIRPRGNKLCIFLLFFFLTLTYSILGSVFQNYASQPSLTPDDDVFKHLSLTYANNHAKMSRGVACKSATPAFDQGITNGAAWYPLIGGMQVSNA